MGPVRPRRLLPWILLASLCGVPAAASGDDVHPKDRYDAAVAAGATGWERIWYLRGDEARLRPTATGDLLLREGDLEFVHRRRGWVLPFDAIAAIDLGRLPGDVDTEWILLTLRDGESGEPVALRDGGAFGFGKRTPEIHAAIAEALESAGAAQWEVPAGRTLFDAFSHQIRLTHPAGWTVIAEDNVYRGGANVAGTVRFDAGDGTGIRLIREPVETRDRCAGLPPGAIDTLRRRVASDPGLLGGGAVPEAVEVEVEEAIVGGCRGVRLRGEGGDRWVEGFAVSTRGTRFLFVATGVDGDGTDRAARLEELETVIGSVEFPAVDPPTHR